MGKLAKLRARQQRRGENTQEARKDIGSTILELFVGYESHSEAEIRDHLRRKGIAKVDLPAALDKLKQRDYLRPVGNSSAWARPREPNRAGRRPYGY